MTAGQYEIIVIGGGMIGASFSLGLNQLGIKTAVVEAFPFDETQQPAYDERTVALTYSARQIFNGLGVWDDIANDMATPIVDIHVSNHGRIGTTHLHCRHAGTDALGYVVPTRVVGKALHKQIRNVTHVDWFQPATADEVDVSNDRVQVKVSSQIAPITGQLLVLADGGRSSLLDQTDNQVDDYQHSAIVFFVRVDRPHNGRAYERFTEEGPLALLPHDEQSYAVVWTTANDKLNERKTQNDTEFLAALQQRFGDRAGLFSAPSPRQVYPLKRSIADSPIRERTVLLGNAAHIVHPVAGQGFNLGLRSAAALLDVLCDESQTGHSDYGASTVLRSYQQQRQQETRRVSQFTHGLLSVFSNDSAIIGTGRGIGLGLVEMLPPLKRKLLRHTMGMAGTPSRLARGIALNSSS